MSAIPDSTSLSSLWMPGSHESASFFGFISTCQRLSLSAQLHLGIRFLDLRFSIKKGILRAYHGTESQRIAALALVEQLYHFISCHPTETVIVSIKQEDDTAGFEGLMRLLLDQRPELWYLENRFPSMSEARGKLMLFSRYGHAPRLGIHPRRWPFNLRQEFFYSISGTKISTQDWCGIVSLLRIPEKFEQVTNLALMPVQEDSFKLNFTSATAIYGGVPTLIANGFGWPRLGLGLRGVNARLLDFLRELQQTLEFKSLQGGQCFMMDFVDADIAALIISFNMSFHQHP